MRCWAPLARVLASKPRRSILSWPWVRSMILSWVARFAPLSVALVYTKVSLPAPLRSVSASAPPLMMSPPLPSSISLPARAKFRSLLVDPGTVSKPLTCVGASIGAAIGEGCSRGVQGLAIIGCVRGAQIDCHPVRADGIDDIGVLPKPSATVLLPPPCSAVQKSLPPQRSWVSFSALSTTWPELLPPVRAHAPPRFSQNTTPSNWKTRSRCWLSA
jgi:hypothetical protein